MVYFVSHPVFVKGESINVGVQRLWQTPPVEIMRVYSA